MQNQKSSLNLYCNMLYTVCNNHTSVVIAPFLGQIKRTNSDLNFKIKSISNLWGIAKPVCVIIWMLSLKA